MADQKKQNFYELLEIQEDATEQQIKTQYRKLALKYHPDKCTGDIEEAKQKFQKISEAYATLSDKKKREHYDQFGSMDDMDGQGFDFDMFMSGSGGMQDIFDSVFSDMGFFMQSAFRPSNRKAFKKFGKNGNNDVFDLFSGMSSKPAYKSYNKSKKNKKNNDEDNEWETDSDENEGEGWETESEEDVDDEQEIKKYQEEKLKKKEQKIQEKQKKEQENIKENKTQTEQKKE